jgi:lysophospholipase L1-like esterase
MKRIRLVGTIVLIVACLTALGCAKTPNGEIRFLYLALGASDATGVGALPLTEGYVFLIKQGLDKHLSGVALLNLGVPGARIDLIKEQVRVATQVGTKPNLITLWTGANDLIQGDDPGRFRSDLRFILENLRKNQEAVIVVANLPDVTQLPRFRKEPDPDVTLDRVATFNHAIEQEGRAVNAFLVDLFAQPVREDLVFDIDGFHPNDAGHREIARLFLTVILPALRLK